MSVECGTAWMQVAIWCRAQPFRHCILSCSKSTHNFWNWSIHWFLPVDQYRVGVDVQANPIHDKWSTKTQVIKAQNKWIMTRSPFKGWPLTSQKIKCTWLGWKDGETQNGRYNQETKSPNLVRWQGRNTRMSGIKKKTQKVTKNRQDEKDLGTECTEENKTYI